MAKINILFGALVYVSVAFANDNILENAHYLLIIDEKSMFYEAKFISENEQGVKVKIKDGGRKNFIMQVPRDKIIRCIKPQKKEYIKDVEFKDSIFKIKAKCSNGYVKTLRYHEPGTYFPEVDNINGVRKGSKVRIEDIWGFHYGYHYNEVVKVEHIFSNGEIRFYNFGPDGYRKIKFIDRSRVKLVRDELLLDGE